MEIALVTLIFINFLADVVGMIGVFLIVIAYTLLQAEKLKSEQLSYSVMNAVGSALIIFSLFFNFNFSAFVVEFFWMLVSIYGISKFFCKRTQCH